MFSDLLKAYCKPYAFANGMHLWSEPSIEIDMNKYSDATAVFTDSK